MGVFQWENSRKGGFLKGNGGKREEMEGKTTYLRGFYMGKGGKKRFYKGESWKQGRKQRFSIGFFWGKSVLRIGNRGFCGVKTLFYGVLYRVFGGFKGKLGVF